MARGPLPGERLLARPRSNASREQLRSLLWLSAVVWFVAPPAFAFHLSMPALVAVPASLLLWVAGFIVLGRLSRGLAPLPDPAADPGRVVGKP